MLNRLYSSEENCTSLGLRDQRGIEEPLKIIYPICHEKHNLNLLHLLIHLHIALNVKQAASSIQNVARYKSFLRFHAVLSVVFWFKWRAKQTANLRSDKIYLVSQ